MSMHDLYLLSISSFSSCDAGEEVFDVQSCWLASTLSRRYDHTDVDELDLWAMSPLYFDILVCCKYNC